MLKNLKRLIFGIGLYKVGTTIGMPLYHNYLQYYGKQLDLKQTFGKSTDNNGKAYAAITGCTDLLGKALAIELAKHGINLILLASNLEQLN